MAYKDKAKQAEAAARHYLANKEKMKAKALAHNEITRLRNKNHLKEYLSRNPCVDCGENDIEVLEFDHIDRSSKIDNVCKLASKSCSISKIQKEIDKCQVRCANCHRRKTNREKDWIPV